MDAVPGLVQLCVQRLAHNLIKYGPKKVRYCRLSGLPWRALELLLDTLVARNALSDNILPYALTRQTQKLSLEGSSHLRRCVLNTIGRSCPNLRVLDVRGCQQVGNRIVRDVLQFCEHLTTLRLDGCARISDSAFAPALWRPPLGGLLGLCELSIAKCSQVTEEGLMGYVMKGAPFLNSLGLAACRLTVTDEVASELLFSFGLESLDLSFCSQITDAPFQARPACVLRELHVANTQISDEAFEHIAHCAKELEVLNAGWVLRLTDRGVAVVTEGCAQLKSLCICNTQVTNRAFEAIARNCRHLECLDASWCMRASWHVLGILSELGATEADAASLPPLKELRLDHLGCMFFDFGSLPVPASPGLRPRGPPTRAGAGSLKSPQVLPWLARMASEPQPFALPPPVTSLSPLIRASTVPAGDEPLHASELLPDSASPYFGDGAEMVLTTPPAALKAFSLGYAASLRQLLLDGVRDMADSTALEVIAESCKALEELALTFPAPGGDGASRSSDAALADALRAVGSSCRCLRVLRLDSTLRPHRALISPLAPPSFGQLRSLALSCAGKCGGLQDGELEQILTERKGLEALELRNCEGLSDAIFPKWCNRERQDEAEVLKQLDDALLSSLSLGFGAASEASTAAGTADAGASRPMRRRHLPRCAPALALRSVTYFSLGGASALSDRSGAALAELLHNVQTADVRGCPLLTEDSLRSFRKGCRFLRSVSIVTRDRTLSWTAATSAVKKHHSRRSSFPTSGSSGTESN